MDVGLEDRMGVFKRFALFCGGGALTLGVAAAVGWGTGSHLLASLNESFIPMAQMTASLVILLGLSLVLSVFWPQNKWSQIVSLVAGVIGTLVSMSALGHFFFDLPFHFEKIFLSPGSFGAVPLGRMSPVTSASFLLMYVSTLVTLWERRRGLPNRIRKGPLLACLPAVSSFIVMLGYLYGAPLLYRGDVIPMAATTAIACLFLSIGIVAVEGVYAAPLCWFSGESTQARLLRSFLPMSLIAAILSGFLFQILPSTWKVNPAVIAASTAVIFIVVITLFVFRASQSIGHSIDQAENSLRLKTGELERSNRDLEQFAYVASHDLQEPLRKILTFGEMLEKSNAEVLDDRGRDYVRRMRNASSRMRNLIDDLLHYSRVTTKAGPSREVNLQDLVREVILDLEDQIVRSKGRVEVGDLPLINAEESQMRQLFQNLIGNALKFHKNGQEPHVVVRSGAETSDFVEVIIEDNGIGFDPKFTERIFQPFQRLHARDEYEGTGMGLAICEKIVQRHSGRISARGDVGKGSVFTIAFPKR